MARQLDLRPSTVQNLINTLCEQGLVCNGKDDRLYRLGAGLWSLGRGLDVAAALPEAIDPVMQELTVSSGAASEVVCWDDGRYRRVGLWDRDGRWSELSDTVDEQRRVHHRIVGQVLLAFSAESRRRGCLQMAEYADLPNLPRSEAELLARLEAVRLAGYATSDQCASAAHLVGAAVPVLAGDGRCLAALNLHRPRGSESDAGGQIDELLAALLAAAPRLAERIVGGAT